MSGNLRAAASPAIRNASNTTVQIFDLANPLPVDQPDRPRLLSSALSCNSAKMLIKEDLDGKGNKLLKYNRDCRKVKTFQTWDVYSKVKLFWFGTSNDQTFEAQCCVSVLLVFVF